MGDPLFRHAPMLRHRVFDAHVNALPPGFDAPRSFYSAIHAESLLQREQYSNSGNTQFIGGCVTPPAGVPLLEASKAIEHWTKEHAQWRPLLRLDPQSAVRPLTRLASVGAHFRRPGRNDKLYHTIEKTLQQHAFAGIKLMPHATGLPDESVLQLIRERRLPVLVHAGLLCRPRWLQKHLLPQLDGPLIFAHLGSWPCSTDDLQEAVAMARDDERVYLETSGASIGNFLRYAIEQVPLKVLFGSNSPMCSAAVQWQHVASSINDDQLLNAVGYDNAQRVFARSDSGTHP